MARCTVKEEKLAEIQRQALLKRKQMEEFPDGLPPTQRARSEDIANLMQDNVR